MTGKDKHNKQNKKFITTNSKFLEKKHSQKINESKKA